MVNALPPPLPGDPKRQAVDSQLGDIYQGWWSIEAWLRIKQDEVVYLECAEDFDVARHGSAVVVQVRHTAQAISLANQKALTALENFWALSQIEIRPVEYQYITTSSVAREKGGEFGDVRGLDAWRVAKSNAEVAGRLRSFLLERLPESSLLRGFLLDCTIEEFQSRILRRFHWVTDQPDLESLKQSVSNLICEHLYAAGQPVKLAEIVRKFLHDRYWEVLAEPEAARRILTRAELLRVVEQATTTFLPIPAGQMVEFLSQAQQGLGLFRHLLAAVPPTPSPLLQRTQLRDEVSSLVRGRRAVLLRGEAFKGKTTLAQLVASDIASTSAWWVEFGSLTPSQVNGVFLSAMREPTWPPALIVVDDLDIGPLAYRIYKNSLAELLRRAFDAGCAVLITAQGSTSGLFQAGTFPSVVMLEIPAVTDEEATQFCVDYRCPAELAQIWGPLLVVTCAGHPALVQARLMELSESEWPAPNAEQIFRPSSSVESAKSLARQLFCATVDEATATFVYSLSEASIPLRRSTALTIGRTVRGLVNPGDAIDSLMGRWVESIDSDKIRITAMIRGQATQVWDARKVEAVHGLLYDAIRKEVSISQFEAAALLLHAFKSRESHRIVHSCISLQTQLEEDAKKIVYSLLTWVPFVAVTKGEKAVPEPIANATFRSLQFHVAIALESELTEQIVDRWHEAVASIPQREVRAAMQTLHDASVVIDRGSQISIRPRLRSALSIYRDGDDLLPIARKGLCEFAEDSSQEGVDPNATPIQLALFFAIRSAKSKEDLLSLVDWLENEADDRVRQQFDDLLAWPASQQLGAFVQGAWASRHEDAQNWSDWLVVLTRLRGYAVAYLSRNFGREVAKAEAIIRTEYLNDSDGALTALCIAEESFGNSYVLTEQRANTLFQIGRDEEALSVWDAVDDAGVADPYAIRRAAISAFRLGRYSQSAQLFLRGADVASKAVPLKFVQFGFAVDAAGASAVGGDVVGAAMLLGRAVRELPLVAWSENEPRWEAVLRAASTTRSYAQEAAWPSGRVLEPLPPGFASAPGLIASPSESGQRMRTAITQAQCLWLAATLGQLSAADSTALVELSKFPSAMVRRVAVEAQLAVWFSSLEPAGFIPVVSALALCFVELASSNGSVALDEGPSCLGSADLDRWVLLLPAAAVVAGDRLPYLLEVWDQQLRAGSESGELFIQCLAALRNGWFAPRTGHVATGTNSVSDTFLRLGKMLAAAQAPIAAKDAYAVQLFVSRLLAQAGVLQPLFSFYVARSIREWWMRRTNAGTDSFDIGEGSISELRAKLESATSTRQAIAAIGGALREPVDVPQELR